MKDFQTQLAEATNQCSLCSHEFDEDNPCCCDDGLFETLDGILHIDGVCLGCCKCSTGRFTPSAQHERSE
jgi:hypothetical protein